ncbi:DUF3185 domain-containing protein [Urbifossiella limnaea]|uniref:DUF3185 domain-containing protein n=1 Tax=Urbifossiella limnaea TaxID=2528023 RepID=A0A517XVJ0_9BACT|nr:DUF3185 domain-containing protein [Urbifossiella limnaea]QDU21528.1 hypothetical protein ETAA1_34950 [Urbifossiella limnaea]
MRALSIIGILLIVMGVVALAVGGFTFFTTERVVDAGPLQIDVQKPHTIILNPIVGVVAAVAGVALVLADRRATA